MVIRFPGREMNKFLCDPLAKLRLSATDQDLGSSHIVKAVVGTNNDNMFRVICTRIGRPPGSRAGLLQRGLTVVARPLNLIPVVFRPVVPHLPHRPDTLTVLT